MSVTFDQLEQFHEFAKSAISGSGQDLSLEELWDRWRLQNPTDEEVKQDLLAVKAALRDMQDGDGGLSAEDHLRKIREKYGLATGS